MPSHDVTSSSAQQPAVQPRVTSGMPNTSASPLAASNPDRATASLLAPALHPNVLSAIVFIAHRGPSTTTTLSSHTLPPDGLATILAPVSADSSAAILAVVQRQLWQLGGGLRRPGRAAAVVDRQGEAQAGTWSRYRVLRFACRDGGAGCAVAVAVDGRAAGTAPRLERRCAASSWTASPRTSPATDSRAGGRVFFPSGRRRAGAGGRDGRRHGAGDGARARTWRRRAGTARPCPCTGGGDAPGADTPRPPRPRTRTSGGRWRTRPRGRSSRGGRGWCTTVGRARCRSDVAPVLAINIWEHAYYSDYQERKGEYVAGFLDRAGRNEGKKQKEQKE